MTQTATAQFTAKTFAAFIVKNSWSKSKDVARMNGYMIQERLPLITWHVERLSRRDIYEDAALPWGYNQAAYGLQWSVNSGRVGGKTVLALRAMSVRENCALIHTLLTECGENISLYPRFLMERYEK